MMQTYKLEGKIPTSCNSIVYVVGKNYYFVTYGQDIDMTWKELLEKSIVNKKAKYGSCIIIIEEPTSGKLFQFGNYDREFVYEHGNSKGYA